ncbi:hypothetical protein [Bacteroides faecis]|jgi:hypothetical protein|uniref:Prophage tail endopeptidase domain-containing protein n=1 Tax=Bacteroides faecis TaxID=674529 RepID=A0A6N2WLC9_9BACE|nr:hypothetical protein [Bacteroides faecis]MCS3068646.1 hypothetical protein [Bacteroides faecis]MCS3125022.1 hypothetical protein [Bacteroides faecis]UVQ58385.1 hypothetical protein NXY18_16770 [Bacteroides faecis]
MIILYSGNKEIKLDVKDESYSYEAIMAEDTLNLYFSYPGYLEIPVGTWCDFYGKRYSLKKDSNFKKKGERNFEYTLILETAKADAMMWKVRHIADNSIKFAYTAKAHEHLRLLVENLNRRDMGWKVGDCIEGTDKVINYNHTYILDALNQLADTYETEWQITGKTVHLRKVEYNKNNPLKLSYGKGHGFKVGVGRESGDIPPEIVLVETSDRNINYSTYGAKYLLLPKSKTLHYEGRRYITDADGTSVMRADKSLVTGKEDSLDCTAIYPSRIGTVSSVIEVNKETNFYDFVDSDIPNDLDFKKCLIAGETMTVIFQTGTLTGKEFEVKYIHEPILKENGEIEKAGRRFEIVPQEIDGITMPEPDVWHPKTGDTYAVFGIQLPNSYICNDEEQTGASWEVFKEAAKYLFEHEDKSFVFTGTLDGIWAKKRWLEIGGKIVLGGYVDFSDTQFHPEGSLIRMIGIKRYVNNPYSPEIELSNDPVGTSVTSELDKIETNEVDVDIKYKDSLRFTKRRFRDAKETMSMLENALLNFSGSINPITIQTMQLLVGDESLQFRFVRSKAVPVQVSHNITYNINTKVLHSPAGIIQHMTLGIKTVSSEHKASEYKFWDMAEYNSPALIAPEKKYYLYAVCSKENQTGTFLLSETAIKMEQIAGYYHLLTGILNSEYEGERSFVELYGFTEVLPGRVTTERIISPDGKTYFDLVKSEIGGNIQIKAGSSGLENLEEWLEVSDLIDSIQKSAADANDAVGGLHDYIDGAFADGIITEAEAKAIEKYINTVNNAKAAVEATYNKLYANTYLTGVAKTNLLNAKITLMGAIERLINAINTAIADKLTTPDEKQAVDTQFAGFNSAYADFNTAVEEANKSIQDKLKSFADDAMKKALEALKDAADATKAAEKVNDDISDLHKYVDGAFADGIISEAETKAIEKYINTVKNTKASVEATYNKLYVNTYLVGVAKTNLLNAKISLFGAIDNLLAAINVAIADGQTTTAEKKNVDDKFALFNSTLASFNTAVEAANQSIQDALKQFADNNKAELDILSDRISAQVTRVDSITQRIDTAGWITTADGNKIYASKELENGNTLISYINQAGEATTIHSSKINLEGAVTITALHSDLQTVINSKVDRDGLGGLAFKDAVEAAQLGSTIIIGGYLNTDLIKVRRIDAEVGFVGGFTIEKGRLIWTRSDYFGGTSRSLKLGSGTSKEGVVNVTFNPATDGRFGVAAIGANAGGSAAIYGSSKTNPTYPSNYVYAGFFDGNVTVLGDVSARGFFPQDNSGNSVSVVSDAWLYGLKNNQLEGIASKNMKIHIIKGMIVECSQY